MREEIGDRNIFKLFYQHSFALPTLFSLRPSQLLFLPYFMETSEAKLNIQTSEVSLSTFISLISLFSLFSVFYLFRLSSLLYFPLSFT